MIKINKSIKNIFKTVGKQLFKSCWTCNLCGKEIFNGEYFCDDCNDKILKNNSFVCLNCGRKTPNTMERCISCKDEWSIDFARSVYVYESEIATLIKKYKYSNNKWLGDIFVEQLKLLYLQNAFFADVVTFVPMTKSRLFERGFNHSKYLACCLSNSINVKCEKLLEKVKETSTQVKLNKKLRSENLLNAFRCVDNAEIKGKRILLVDDVLTTGATSNEIAKTLKKQGAISVSLLTIASTSVKAY